MFQNIGDGARAGLICAVLLAGCTSASKQAGIALDKPRRTSRAIAESETVSQTPPALLNSAKRGHVALGKVSPIELASYDGPLESSPAAADPTAGTDADLFSGQLELDLPELERAVQRRNPSLKAALAAWGVAAEKFPQAVALDDPMLQTMLAPGTLASNSSTQASYILGIGQKIPWSGKRRLRGQVAQWNAVAASLDHDEVQLRLTEAARIAYYEYYNVFRLIDLNDANLQALQSFRETAESKFEANLVPQQDVLQADVELAKLEQRRVEIEQQRVVASARINTLLHREPQVSLPPPPRQLIPAAPLPSVEELRARAIDQRPDLAAMAARIQSEQNVLALTYKDYYPDFEIIGKYDSFWTDVVQRGQIAMNLNIPLYQDRRQAAVREAIFRVAKMQADFELQVDMIRNEVHTGYAIVEASRRTLELYTGKVLPAAQGNVEAASSGYTAGTVDFLRLVQAQRELIELKEKYQQAIVDYNRNRAELDRVVGTAPADSRELP
ncbi:MAG TPA: TolC family protein [Planctomycetaceae bacterium]